MATRKEKVNAGLFLLIGTLLLTATVALITGLNLERSGEVFLVKIPKSVGGLRESSAVKYLGVTVGRVKKVDFPPEEVESVSVLVEITRPSTPIKSGTYATLSANFLTGETSVELQGGSNEEAPLPPGSAITWRPTTFMRVEDSLPGVLDELKRVVGNINALISDENRAAVAKLIDDLDQLTLEIRREIGPLAGDLRDLKSSLAASGDRIAEQSVGLRQELSASVQDGVGGLKAAAKSIEELSGRLGGVADNLQSGTAGIADTVATIQRTAAQLEETVAATDLLVDDNREELRRALVALRASAHALDEALSNVGSNPSQLFFSKPLPERRRGDG